MYQTTALRKIRQPMELLTSSATDNWHTPGRYIEAAREVMGGIDLDPASDFLANQTVKAARYYTREDDGLALPWSGRVFVNPPYGKLNNKSLQGLFANRLTQEYRAGNVEQAILLVNLYAGYEWYAPLRVMPMCMCDHRISFVNPATGGEDSPAKASSVFIYFGPNEGRFFQVFSRFGPCGRLGYWR